LYTAFITDQQGALFKGILYSVTDSSVLFVPNSPKYIHQLRRGKPELYSIASSQIREISLQRKGQVVHSILVGAGAGVVVSVALAVLTKNLDTGTFALRGGNYKLGNALINVFRGLIIATAPAVGASIGAVDGVHSRANFTIDEGNYSLKSQRSLIEPYSYQYQALSK
jgi:hypothetical protein